MRQFKKLEEFARNPDAPKEKRFHSQALNDLLIDQKPEAIAAFTDWYNAEYPEDNPDNYDFNGNWIYKKED